MGNINDRENREHPGRLGKAVVHGGSVAMAPQPLGARVQRYERSDVCVQNGRIVNISMARD